MKQILDHQRKGFSDLQNTIIKVLYNLNWLKSLKA